VLTVDQIPWFSSACHSQAWLVGVSGGADSVALLHLLKAAGFLNLTVCHLDHGLRGQAAAGDAEFVKRLADQLGYACEVAQGNVRQRMEERRESLETAARHERHAFFAACALKYGCQQVLLGHHADDQAETVLWNLLRGSHGLRGMQTVQKFTTETGVELEWIRPLLGVCHSDLVRWLETGGHPWREDLSNAEPIAIRNRLRNEVLPQLAEISGRDAVAALGRGARVTEEWLELETWALAQTTVLDPQGRLHLPTLRGLPRALQRRALRRFLEASGIRAADSDLLERGLSLLEVEHPAVINLPGGGKLRRRAARLSVEPG
jgi:tRNA(Ile)-lysidine synthase